MKNLKFILETLSVVSFFVFMTVSCDPENPETDGSAANAVEGVYVDDMTCSVMGSESVFEDVTFTLEAVSGTEVRVSVSSFGNPPMQVPGFSVGSVKVTGSDGRYVLAATEFSGENSEGKTYSGTIQGSFEAGLLTVGLSLQYGAMPMPLICTFKASRQ
ncbi:MAG: calycin-like domain-containing protein [Candidatus Aphodosoma sp.]